jgi:hypothetical protein
MSQHICHSLKRLRIIVWRNADNETAAAHAWTIRAASVELHATNLVLLQQLTRLVWTRNGVLPPVVGRVCGTKTRSVGEMVVLEGTVGQASGFRRLLEAVGDDMDHFMSWMNDVMNRKEWCLSSDAQTCAEDMVTDHVKYITALVCYECQLAPPPGMVASLPSDVYVLIVEFLVKDVEAQFRDDTHVPRRRLIPVCEFHNILVGAEICFTSSSVILVICACQDGNKENGGVNASMDVTELWFSAQDDGAKRDLLHNAVDSNLYQLISGLRQPPRPRPEDPPRRAALSPFASP